MFEVEDQKDQEEGEEGEANEEARIYEEMFYIHKTPGGLRNNLELIL